LCLEGCPIARINRSRDLYLIGFPDGTSAGAAENISTGVRSVPPGLEVAVRTQHPVLGQVVSIVVETNSDALLKIATSKLAV
jgi:hypothetical protein